MTWAQTASTGAGIRKPQTPERAASVGGALRSQEAQPAAETHGRREGTQHMQGAEPKWAGAQGARALGRAGDLRGQGPVGGRAGASRSAKRMRTRHGASGLAGPARMQRSNPRRTREQSACRGARARESGPRIQWCRLRRFGSCGVAAAASSRRTRWGWCRPTPPPGSRTRPPGALPRLYPQN